MTDKERNEETKRALERIKEKDRAEEAKIKSDQEVTDAVERLNNDPSREKAGSRIMECPRCAYCDHVFPMQPQDFSRAEVHGLKKVCHRATCRREHTKAGRTSFAEVRCQIQRGIDLHFQREA